MGLKTEYKNIITLQFWINTKNDKNDLDREAYKLITPQSVLERDHVAINKVFYNVHSQWIGIKSILICMHTKLTSFPHFIRMIMFVVT